MAQSERNSPSAETPVAPSRVGWQGGERQASTARHRWQRDWTTTAADRVQSRKRWRRLRIAGLLALSMAMFALLIYYLLLAPAQTPVLAVIATDYDWPWATNAWAQEDLAGLSDLNRQTLRLVDGSDAWTSPQRGLDRLETQLARIKQHPPRTGAVVILISMHGLVDGSGRACLAPPGASPTNSDTWLPVSTLLQTIAAADLPDSLHKLLVFDCNRQRVNWNAGLLWNTFADGMEAAVAEAKIPNLVVLNSTSPGEIGHSAAELRGSLFGHFLRLGLAGAADGSGDRNGRVSLHELHHYLSEHVDRWAQRRRGESQRPMLVPTAAGDFDIAWAERGSAWREMVRQAEQIERASPSISQSDLALLWTSRDRLAQFAPLRYDPLAWRDFEHGLLHLEELASSGQAYADAAATARDKLFGWRDDIQRRIDANESRSQPSLARTFAEETREPAPVLKVHSLAFAQFLGTTDGGMLRQARQQLARLEEPTRTGELGQVVRDLHSVSLPAEFTEVHFLLLLQRYAAGALWSDASILADAVNVHVRAEQLALPLSRNGLPGDERSHFWTRRHFATADSLRRDAVDRFFIGQQASGDQDSPADLWTATKAAYEAVETEQQTLSKALRVRDQAWGTTPYLAQWASRPQSDPAAQSAADELVRQTLLPLIENTRRLGERFWHDEVVAGEASERQQDGIAEATAQQLTALQAAFDEQVQRLAGSLRRDAVTLREIDALLATPLLSWPNRETLKRRRLEITDELAKAVSPVAASGEDSKTSRPAAETLLDEPERMAVTWSQHPLAAILRAIPATEPNIDTPQEPSSEPGERLRGELAAKGEKVRRQLAALASQDVVYGRESAPQESGKKQLNRSDASLLLRDCYRGESLVRAAAAIHFDPPPEDPVIRLRQFHLQQLLLWHAQRALDDYWGPAGARGEPLFALAARDYLAAAKAVGPLNPPAQTKWDEIAALLSDRIAAAEGALGLSAADILSIDQAAGVSTQIELRTRSQAALAGLPAGTAVGFLADAAGRIPGATRAIPHSDLPIAAEAPPLTWRYVLNPDALDNRGPQLQAIAMLRGNEFTAPLLLRATGGTRVDFKPFVYGPPRVTVSGFGRKRSSVVFVLDCSHSMAEQMEIEAPSGQTPARTSRLDVARNALRNLLGQLAERGDARVGVRFYGHRVGWSTTEDSKLLRQNRYASEIDPQLQPYADVEAVLPLGRFDSVAAGKVYDVLATVEPWGESPLYLALTQALQDFSVEDDTTERSIVVITDGVNYQFNPAAGFARSKEDVLAAWRESRVPIHIVGFGIPPADAEAARRDFEEITSRTGGQYYPATNSVAVIRSLHSLLRPSNFTVSDDRGDVVDQAPLDATAVVAPPPARPEPFVVELEGIRQPIELAGGEAVELVVSRDGSRLESPPYRKGVVQQASLLSLSPPKKPGLAVFAHRPVRSSEGVSFPLSLQFDDGRFTPRPGEVWIEIQPRLPAALQPPRYIFYDLNYQPDRPVPVLEWRAEDWPADARQAEIRLWCKPGRTAISGELPLAAIANLPPPSGDGYEFPAAPGVEFQARSLPGVDGPGSLRVAIVERHGSDSPGVGSLKVDLDAQAQRIVRQFDAENRLVLHTFSFSQISDDRAASLKIQITTQEQIQAQSWHLEEPLVVDVSSQADLLKLTPPQP